MRKATFYRLSRGTSLQVVLVALSLALATCASFSAGGQVSGEDGEISARGAIGRLEAAVSGPMFEGDGGKEIRLAVLAPEAQGAAPEYLPVYVQGLLNNNFKKYSGINLFSRQDLDRIMAEQDIAVNGRFTDADYVKIGGLTNVQYYLFGTIQKLSGDQYSLRLSVSDSVTGVVKADFMKNGTLRQIEGNGLLINEASADLLAQLGVQLTAAGRQSLIAGNTAVVRSETGLAKGITAQASGASVEALFNYTQAINFDSSQIEALARLNVLSSSISGGSLSERIVNDLQARDRWLGAFKEAARFFNEHPPFEITFDPNLMQEGETDYAKRTANLAMRIALDPSEAGFAAINALLAGLEKTGRRNIWGFNGWPLQDISPKTPGTVVFAGKQTFGFKLDVTLLNENGKAIGKSSVTLNSGSLHFVTGQTELSAPRGAVRIMRFANVKADDLTPSLTIVISAVNGIPSATLNANGYMRIDTGDLEKKFAASKLFDYNYYNGDFDRAIADYTQAIRLDPKDAVAYKQRGTAYGNKKDPNHAIADYNQAIKLDPDFALAYNNRGSEYRNNGDYDQAIADYTEAIRLDPNYVFTYNSRGNVYYSKGDYDQAITDYTEAIRLDPNFVVAYSYRGNAYRNKDDYDRAIADYTEAIRLDPDSALAYFNRGYVYGNKSNHDRAIADYTEAIRLDPNDAMAYNNRGVAYQNKGDYDQAIADYEAALRIDPNHTLAKNNLQNAQDEKAGKK
ncbi:tetratricopeptide repeat protein [Treponema primitia]|uniref:tetratricopeptide repeat protein n=1 Tax=Treponema primitia TaxID=88058 RepID=UPI00397EF576